MKKIGLDTSIVLRLFMGEPHDQARSALRWLGEAKVSGVTLVISDLVASEVYFALQHHFGVPKAQALRQLALFLASGDVSADGVLGAVLATPGLATAKPGFVDRLIHAQYMCGNAEMATFEKAARTLPGVDLLEA